MVCGLLCSHSVCKLEPDEGSGPDSLGLRLLLLMFFFPAVSLGVPSFPPRLLL